ncbi:MAG: T9SS type A sorting domain-containing protein [Candidatus Cloacimonetes bacterium]|nr:T9SS type A sorting domain-containing protein [Candidatus Cloacimonadota bacterium]
MKKIVLVTLLICALVVLSAELVNINPDPNGEPWMVGGIPEITPEIKQKLDKIPKLEISSLRTELPESIDNSENDYFPGIFSQGKYGSCSQAAGIGYTLTYEINRLRNINSEENPDVGFFRPWTYHYTWNFLNRGTNSGTLIPDGWDIVKENGCPNAQTWGLPFGWHGFWANPQEYQVWMTGYDKYSAAMENRISEYSKIDITTEEGLETLKQWLYDHGDESVIGGIANFSVNYFSDISYSGDVGNKFIINAEIGEFYAHSLTIVGYDDSFAYDFDGENGIPENYEIEEMQNWERGALKIANTHGTSYQDSGFVFLPYRFLAYDSFLYTDDAFVMKALETYSPSITAQIELTHNIRHKIKIEIGMAQDSEATEPTHSKTFTAFDFKGGTDSINPYTGLPTNLPMVGINDDPIEIELDITSLLQEIYFAEKIFLDIVENDSENEASGEIISFAVVDYRENSAGYVTEYSSTLPDTIVNGLNRLAIDYDTYTSDADLAISSDCLPDISYSGNIATKIFNSSTSSISNVQVNLYLDEVNENNLISYHTITSTIDPLSFEEFSFSVQPNSFDYGMNRLIVVIDPNNSIIEVSKDNNTTEKIINIVPDNHIFQDVLVDETWDCETMYIYKDITISADATLTIESGVTVKFLNEFGGFYGDDGYYGITINGELKVNGTEEKNVIFTVDDPTGFSDITSKDGSWKGLYFENTDQSNSSYIKYTQFEYIKVSGVISIKKYRPIIIDSSNNISIENCSFTLINILNEIAYSYSPQRGLALNIFDSNAIVVTNCILNGNIIDNTLPDYYYYIYMINVDNSTIEFTNNNVTNNSLWLPGIGIFNESQVNIYNNIFWGNSCYFNHDWQVIVNESDFNFSNNLIQGGYEGLNGLDIDDEQEFLATNSIDTNPEFIENGDFNLSINSPCIDAGNPDSPKDPDGSTADIGAKYLPLIPQNIQIVKNGTNMELSWENEAYINETVLYKSVDFEEYLEIGSTSTESISTPINGYELAFYKLKNIVNRDPLPDLVSEFSKVSGFKSTFCPFDVSQTRLNTIAIPFETEYEMISDFGDDYAVDAISRWHVPAQSWASTCNLPVIGWFGDYPLETERSYMVGVTENETIYIIGNLSDNPVFNLIHNTEIESRNFMYLPFDQYDITNSGALGDSIGTCYKVQKWDPSDQEWDTCEFINSVWVDTFSISIGDPLMVYVNENTTWPGETRQTIIQEDEDHSVTPLATTMYNNYPNPFNPTTTISFYLQSDSVVKLDIFNIKGQKVKTIAYEKFTSGKHSLVWDGKDKNNRPVASGVYFYKMKSNNYDSVKKMLMIK